jgi:transcriptional regulator with XRE-family HTH domain
MATAPRTSADRAATGRDARSAAVPARVPTKVPVKAPTKVPAKAPTMDLVTVSLSEQQRQAVSNVGARLRRRREEAGLSLRHFARTLGVSASFLSQLEKGKSRPSVATLYLICNALQLSIDELFTPEEPVAAPDDAPEPEADPAKAKPGGSVRAALDRPQMTGDPATDLWSAPDGRSAPSSPLMRPSERPVLVLDSGVTWENLTSMHEAAVDFMFVRYEVGGGSTLDGRFIRHMGSEYGYVISGSLEVTLGFEK